MRLCQTGKCLGFFLSVQGRDRQVKRSQGGKRFDKFQEQKLGRKSPSMVKKKSGEMHKIKLERL